MYDIKERVIYLRQASGRSSSGFSVAAGLSRSAVRLIEVGTRGQPETATLLAICRVTGANLDWLASGTGDPPNESDVRETIDRLAPLESGAAE